MTTRRPQSGGAPDDPTLLEIVEVASQVFSPVGVVQWLHAGRYELCDLSGRRRLYADALALAEGVFT